MSQTLSPDSKSNLKNDPGNLNGNTFDLLKLLLRAEFYVNNANGMCKYDVIFQVELNI